MNIQEAFIAAKEGKMVRHPALLAVIVLSNVITWILTSIN